MAVTLPSLVGGLDPLHVDGLMESGRMRGGVRQAQEHRAAAIIIEGEVVGGKAPGS